jgi:hypothetical protein
MAKWILILLIHRTIKQLIRLSEISSLMPKMSRLMILTTLRIGMKKNWMKEMNLRKLMKVKTVGVITTRKIIWLTFSVRNGLIPKFLSSETESSFFDTDVFQA